MFNKKFLSILVSSMVITGSLALSSINVNAATKNGWTKVTATTWCYYSNGKLAKNVWEQNILHNWYYFGGNGIMIRNSLISINGLHYYINASGVKTINQWVVINGNRYFFNCSGVMAVNQWVSVYFVGGNGAMLKNTTVLGYRLGANGARVSNVWCLISSKWCYLGSGGTISTDITPSHVTVGKVGCAYSSIQQAINSVPNCAITLIIQPGTYFEHVVLIGKNISLQGTNKSTCIIEDDSGNYYTAPLSASGNGNISNLTFISTHNKANYTIPSYALHCDYSGAGTLTFTNCSFTSYQNSAVGIGMHQSQTLIFNNCDMRKNSNYPGGALYCHNDVGSNVTNQNLIVKNSHITTNIGVALRIDDASSYNHNHNSQMNVAFYNNILSSDQMGITNSIVYFRDAPVNGGISGQIKLTKDSSGNNVSVLNALK